MKNELSMGRACNLETSPLSCVGCSNYYEYTVDLQPRSYDTEMTRLFTAARRTLDKEKKRTKYILVNRVNSIIK